jgi:hypothetical protein
VKSLLISLSLLSAVSLMGQTADITYAQHSDDPVSHIPVVSFVYYSGNCSEQEVSPEFISCESFAICSNAEQVSVQVYADGWACTFPNLDLMEVSTTNQGGLPNTIYGTAFMVNLLAGYVSNATLSTGNCFSLYTSGPMSRGC